MLMLVMGLKFSLMDPRKITFENMGKTKMCICIYPQTLKELGATQVILNRSVIVTEETLQPEILLRRQIDLRNLSIP
jgi:hypothetical protein